MDDRGDTMEAKPANDLLEMNFDPNVINHLGIQMYSTLPPVIAELVANAYDAEAENVKIYLNDAREKEIIIEDDGHGMSFDEINSSFLIVGRNRRQKEQSERSRNGKRFVIGRKGIGKLAFFGIAKHIRIETVQNYLRTTFELDWEDLKKQGEVEKKYTPELLEKEDPADIRQGTKIILTEIKRKSDYDPEALALSLAKGFQIFDEPDFDVFIIYNNDEDNKIKLENKLRYKHLTEVIAWEFPRAPKEGAVEEYEFANKIKGRLLASETTVPSDMRGVALFSRGKLVNDYSFYDIKATSHGYSYITGWLNIDFIEDEFEEDVISTNRQSLNWELNETEALKKYLQKVIRAFFNEYREEVKRRKKNKVKEITDVDPYEWIQSLPTHERALAKKICDSILNAQGIEVHKAAELIRYTLDSFRFEAFKELAGKIDAADLREPEKIISLFKEWEVVEARELFRIAQVRLQTIEKFDAHIKGNAREVPELHNFFKQFPWILDPRIMNFQDEVTYSKLLREHFNDADLDGPDRRIDFLCQNFADSFFIIELKRPKTVINSKILDQALAYISFIRESLGNEYGKNIYCYIIGGRLANSDEVKMKAESFRKSQLIYVKPYSELLDNARKYHQEFIDKYTEMTDAYGPPGGFE